MSNVKSMENLDNLDKLLGRFPKGIKISEIPGKLGCSRSTVYEHLNSLVLMGKAHYENGTAFPGKASSSAQDKLTRGEHLELLKEKMRLDSQERIERMRAEAMIRSAELEAYAYGERQ